MFETSFSHSSALPIPPNLSIENAVSILHDFETVIKFNPDTRGCKQIPSKNGYAKTNGNATVNEVQFFEVEDDLPFIPKRLWAGGVKYRADFYPVADGCDITVHAPGGFNSTNHWRLLRDLNPEQAGDGLERVQSKDMLHADTTGSGWYVQIISDASCNKTFAGFVKGFLKNAQSQLQQNFIERLRATPSKEGHQEQPPLQQQRSRRPTLGRRKSSVL